MPYITKKIESMEWPYGLYRNSFSGLDAQTFSPDDLHYAQDHLGILSAMYGWVRPLDSLCQYRLEMALRSPKTNIPYHDFWRQRITDALCAHVNALDTKYILDLMSAEYSKSVEWTGLHVRL